MDLNKSLSILELNYPFSLSELKSAYYKAALKHHPDRNPKDIGSTQKFQAAAAAYEFLSVMVDDNEHPYTSCDNSYQNILNNFIYYAMGKKSKDLSTIIHQDIQCPQRLNPIQNTHRNLQDFCTKPREMITVFVGCPHLL